MSEIQFNIKKPCAACPFRTVALRGWLGRYTPQEVVNAVKNEEPFLCHDNIERTTGYRGEDWYERAVADGVAEHCAGALIFAKKMCKLPRDPDHSAAVKAIEPCEILWPPQAFIDYHNRQESEYRDMAAEPTMTVPEFDQMTKRIVMDRTINRRSNKEYRMGVIDYAKACHVITSSEHGRLKQQIQAGNTVIRIKPEETCPVTKQ